jgi:diadenylate cyclase
MSALATAFTWRDALDILLVSFVVYRGLVMFRGTRSVQMLIGLGVLVGGSLLARRLELHTVQWILDQFWALWAVALVVLFQPELRRALARMGEGTVVRGLFTGREAGRVRVIEEVSRAAYRLAADRVGALIVIERTGALRPYAELGVALEAVVSADLLQTLFLPGSPLHDGAVLIRGTRAVAAGCFLPLSRNLQVGRHLGTRHRAALGISEETDAVAVAVSEETGRVSVAVDGVIESEIDAAALQGRLYELLLGAAPVVLPGRLRLGVRA